jgi:L-rhamnose mutarotase
MSKVIFTIQYELEKDRQEEYLSIIHELKNLLKADGLEDYTVFSVKGKPNHFQEQYTFTSEEAFEAFDDENDERINILINQLSNLTIDHSTKYLTLSEIT